MFTDQGHVSRAGCVQLCLLLFDLALDGLHLIKEVLEPSDLEAPLGETEQIPMAVESFVHSLGISLTEEEKSQLHGLLKRPIQDPDDPTKRRKTDASVPATPGKCG